MRVFVPEISWHNKLPALSLDISKPTDELGNKYRIATGGNDSRVYIWLITLDETTSTVQQPLPPVIEIRAGLRRHQKSVGAVRFSPTAHMLASGDDDGYIYLWKYKLDLEREQQQNSYESNNFLNDDGFEDLELWQQQRVLRGHIEDICDLAWSKDGQFLLSGSVDNSAILWDTLKGTKVWCSDLIKGYVQGVAIDPHAQFMAAISSDRTLRIYNFADKRQLYATRRMNIQNKFKAFFCDDTVKTFCRRLEFSPDGQFLLAPTSRLIEKETKTTSTPTNGDDRDSQTELKNGNQLPSDPNGDDDSCVITQNDENDKQSEAKNKTKEIEIIQLEDSAEEPTPPTNKLDKSTLSTNGDANDTSIRSNDSSESQESQDEAKEKPQQPPQPTVKKYTQALLVFKRSSFNRPTYFYPTGEVALCARFSPVVYQLREDEINFWGIPYRIVFAVATTRNVIIYDSQQPTPLGYISQIHLARITDIAWSNDGRMLMVTSYDGYSTIVTFEPDEFGNIYNGPLIDPLAKPVIDEEKGTADESLNGENGKVGPEEKPSKKGQKRMKPPKETVAAKKEKLDPEPEQQEGGEVQLIKDNRPPKKATPKKITPTKLPESATLWRFLNKKT